MSADNNQCGIFNDLDNEWMLHFDRNAAAQIYHNGTSKLQTRSDGVNVSGDLLVGRVGYGNDIGKRIENGGGEYGTVTTQGSRRSWGGYAIQNQWVLMAHTNGNHCGIYNDQDNEWGMYCDRNSHTRLHFNGGEKLRTEDWGVRALGRIHQDGYGWLDDKINDRAARHGSTSYDFSSKTLRTTGTVVLNYDNPTVYLQDTNHNSSMMHCNSSIFYILRGGNNTTSWTTVGGRWPLEINLTNNFATFGSHIRSYGTVYCNDLEVDGGIGHFDDGLRISGTEYSYDYNRYDYALNNAGLDSDPNHMDFGLSVLKAVRANAYVARSDRRIKENIVDIDDTYALEQLRKLKPKYYDYKGKKRTKGTTHYDGLGRVIGFIAQEVKEVVPRAVTTRPGEIPNIVDEATVSEGNIITFATFDTANLEAGNKSIIVHRYEDPPKYVKEKNLTIAEVLDNKRIRVVEDVCAMGRRKDENGNIVKSEIVETMSIEEYEKMKYDFTKNRDYEAILSTDGTTTGYKKTTTIYEGNDIFVHGQEIQDFHFVNKDYLWTIASAALQEVDRQLQAEKMKTARLEERLTTLEEILARNGLV